MLTAVLWRFLPIQIDLRQCELSTQPRRRALRGRIRTVKLPVCCRPRTCLSALRLISAVHGTLFVARKKTSQVTMLEVVVGGLISAFPEPLDFDIEQD